MMKSVGKLVLGQSRHLSHFDCLPLKSRQKIFTIGVGHGMDVRLLSTTIVSRMASKCRQNYHEECEAHVNNQINLELSTSYLYLNMAYYFDRDDVAFGGFSNFFKKNSDEEKVHAETLIKYQNDRGGRLILESIPKPGKVDGTTPMSALVTALEMEKTVNQSLLNLHSIAASHNDAHLCDFIESQFLDEQVKAIKQISDYITQLQRCGEGLGEFIFDKELNLK